MRNESQKNYWYCSFFRHFYNLSRDPWTNGSVLIVKWKKAIYSPVNLKTVKRSVLVSSRMSFLYRKTLNPRSNAEWIPKEWWRSLDFSAHFFSISRDPLKNGTFLILKWKKAMYNPVNLHNVKYSVHVSRCLCSIEDVRSKFKRGMNPGRMMEIVAFFWTFSQFTVYR